MLRKLVAVVLLVLAASPFTAPFATCSISTLFGAGTQMAAGWTSNASVVEDRSAPSVMYGTPRRVRAPLTPASHAATLEGIDVAADQGLMTIRHSFDPRPRPHDRSPARPLRI